MLLGGSVFELFFVIVNIQQSSLEHHALLSAALARPRLLWTHVNEAVLSQAVILLFILVADHLGLDAGLSITLE